MSGILPSAATDAAYGSVTLATEQTRYKRTYAFDFEVGEFVLDTMNRVRSVTDGREVLQQVVDKILHDDRYRYLAYSDAYGNELRTLMAQDYPRDVLESELKRIYREALIYHPLVYAVQDFGFEGENDVEYCSFTVVGVHGIELQIREKVM